MSSASFFVRSEMCDMEGLARRPYPVVHILPTRFLNAADLAAIAHHAYQEAGVSIVGDINTRTARPEDIERLVPGHLDVHERIAACIHSTGVYGNNIEFSRAAIRERMDYLTSLGAPFHNDVVGHWPSCLFWVLALDVCNVEFVMPALDLRHPLQQGELLVFDPCLAHGLCRPVDAGRAVPFDGDAPGRHQAFLSGELRLEVDQWAALGCPWSAHEESSIKGAVDLMTANIDSETGLAQ